ncbi:hypothetical protein GJAV_G00255190 [Gymnothorax javanicus]|nr:hypothetical protein GJAV_G00255190 [Gymnothorax javanicus]
MSNSSRSRVGRYRPASEFDEATLARKREYWRIKKREQRAKLSTLKKERLKVANAKSRLSAELPTTDGKRHMVVALGLPAPTLLKSDGTYEADQCRGLSHDFEYIPDQVETVKNAGHTADHISALQAKQPVLANQKDRWFPHVKLNNILPQFSSASSDFRSSLKGIDRKAVGCRSTGGVGDKYSPTNWNGAPSDKVSQVPACKVKVQQISSSHCQYQNEKPLLNGSSSLALPQHNLVSQGGSQLQDITSGMKLPAPTSGSGVAHATVPVAPQGTEMDTAEGKIKKEVNDFFPGTGSLTTTDSISQTVFPKAEDLNEVEAVDCVVGAVEPVAPRPASRGAAFHQRSQYGSRRWGATRSRMQRQKLLESQRVDSQRNVWRASSPAVALSTKNFQKNNAEETEEERMAKKREYWRIKKREQRAKLSTEVKAKMKERDSLMRRVKRYQSILDEMRKGRAGFGKSRQSTGSGNILPCDNETISGFIKEDGTMTTNIPPVSAGYGLFEQGTLSENQQFPKNLLPVSNYGRGNPVFRKHVQITPPPPLKCAQPMKGTSYSNTMSPIIPSGLVSNRARPASLSVPKSLQNSHMTMPQAGHTVRRLHNVQNVYPGLPSVKLRQAAGKLSACPLQPGVMGARRVPASPSCPKTMVKLHLAPELTEEEKMAKKREYWRIKKREQRAKRSARLRQAMFQSKNSSATQRKQSQRILAARRSAQLNSLRGVPVNCPPNETQLPKPVISTPVQDKLANIKQEEEPGPLEDVCHGLSAPLCPEIKPALSSSTEQPGEQESTANMDTQATTLLAVASMKKLLEESLSSVVDNNDPLPCKTEQVCSEEEEAEVDVKPSLPCLLGGEQGSESAPDMLPSTSSSTPQTNEFLPGELQSPSCLKSSLVPSPIQLPFCQSLASSPAGSPSTNLKQSQPLRGQSPTLTPSCSHTPSVDQPLQLRRAKRLQAKRISLQRCSPEPPKVLNAPYWPDEEVLRKKREAWRIAKREQRARKAAKERKMRKFAEEGKVPAPKPAQGDIICIKVPTLHTKNPPPLVLSSAPESLSGAKAGTTLPILKVFTPVQSASHLCTKASENEAPKKEPSVKLSSHPAANSVASVNCSTLPRPEGGDRRDEVKSGRGGGRAVQLLLVENRQSTATVSGAGSPQVEKLQQPSLASEVSPSSQLGLTKNLPCSALEAGRGTSSQGGEETLTGRLKTCAPSSGNDQPRLGQGDVLKPSDPSKLPKTLEQLDEELRKKREYWRVKKKEQRARKAEREREMKRQGMRGSGGIIPPGTEATRSLDSQGNIFNPWPNGASKDPCLVPSTSCDYQEHPQLCLTGAGKGGLEVGVGVGEEDYGGVGGEEGQEDAPCSEASWRTRFLMDFDPLNQLLVCMVCGELQHSHTLEGVRGHIEEAHPDTLSLEPVEHQRILQAWDEQVFLRERFYSDQLQQHSTALSGEGQELPAEVEVMVDLEEVPNPKNLSKTSKTKSLRKV